MLNRCGEVAPLPEGTSSVLVGPEEVARAGGLPEHVDAAEGDPRGGV